MKKWEKIFYIIVAIIVICGIIGYGIYYYYMRYIYPKGQHIMNTDNYIINEEQLDKKTNIETEDSTFIRTYTVLNVADSNDEDYLYLTIRKFQEEEVETVKVKKSLANIIQKENNYEFTFQYTNNIVEDNIESIFTNAVLIAIKETDKQGLEQTQDSIENLEFNRNKENVTIEVLQNTITKEKVDILITDNNENHYGWGVAFRVQEKANGEWRDLEYISDNLSWIDIAYKLSKDNQLTQKLDIEKYYGKLSNGIYRIVKPVYDNGYIDIYSNEFEIK